MRFAFYGRVSTEDQQDPKASRNWQITRARQLIEPAGGEIIAEFFDVGQSRSLPWSRRPEAAKLLKTLGSSSRAFDAVVIGEPQRAFYGNQFGLTFPVFVHYSVELWVPEVGGAIDPGSDAHEIVMSLYGGMSKGERNRIKTRVRSAMAAQAAMEGRFLGGRPPYGYQLADAGPHPNPAKAAAGQRARHLESNPATAPVVRRIFREFLGGSGLRAIANGLTADGILSPSASDPDRNRHRLANGPEWRFTAVRSILENPRYTGYQVWNKQRRDEILIDVNDVGLGHQTRMRWNDPSEWVWSEEPSHEALVTREDWEAVQTRFRGNKRRYTRTPKRGRHYVLAGRLSCGRCGRRMEGTWNHDRPYYRCQIPRDDPANNRDHPATIYVREDSIVPRLDDWVGELFTEEHLDDTCAKLADAAQPTPTWKHRNSRSGSGSASSTKSSTATAPSPAANPRPPQPSASGSQRPTRSNAGSKPSSAEPPPPDSRPKTSRRLLPACRTSPQHWPRPTRRTRPRSTPRWGSTSPTTRTAGSSSNPGRV